MDPSIFQSVLDIIVTETRLRLQLLVNPTDDPSSKMTVEASEELVSDEVNVQNPSQAELKVLGKMSLKKLQ